jgi:molecular chaperone DnaK
MATDINIQSLFPTLRENQISRPIFDIFNTSFIGIDFGTSTTVVSIATINKETNEIDTKPIWLNQKMEDGIIMSSEKVPTVLAWYKNELLVGHGASNLKYQLRKGINVWYSFKMELGEDLGSRYYNSELDRNSDFPILNPADAAKIFFEYIKAQIDRYIRINNLPSNIQYAVSIPASFEANQRKELIEALEQNGISINKQSLIDEPNAAFLSFVHTSSNENKPLNLPDGDNPNVLVFDFGAGTCDVSILELGKNIKGIYSKNLSISKFEKIGGDDIDRLIAIDMLFPQLLKESSKSHEEFKTPEKTRIIDQLLKSAEQLKIMICENISLKMSKKTLPNEAFSNDFISVGYKIEIDSRKGPLTLTNPKLSFWEFGEIMIPFLKTNSILPYKANNVSDEFTSIFNPIHSALKKAHLTKDKIDYVLFIGGSAKNPYVQSALKEYFTESEILIPRDLQTHVSAGTSIHSLIYNGFNKNIIQPITSEPLLVITKDKNPKTILKAGTHIPCDLIVIDDLVTSHDGQQVIELPICLGNINKILYNIKIFSSTPNGFKRNTPVRLELEVTTDKLLFAKASTNDQSVLVEPINPFANKELTTEQRIVLKAERQANIEAEQNGGIPTKQGLDSLYKAYEKVGNSLRAAETLELLNEIYPSLFNYNKIGLLYASAGYDEKALENYEQSYSKSKNATSAFNYAYKLKDKDKEKYKEILTESFNLDPEHPHSMYELGKILQRENNPKGETMIQNAFNIWKVKFEINQISESEYSWLSSAAERLGMKDYAKHVRESKPKTKSEHLFEFDNLTITNKKEGLIKK